MMRCLDTMNTPRHRRLAEWRDIVSDTFVPLDCHSDMGADFFGSVRSASLGRLMFTRVQSCRQRVVRSPVRIAQAREEFVLLALAEQDSGEVRQDNREITLTPGQFTLYDSTRPYELGFNGAFSQTIIQMPRRLLTCRLGHTHQLTATVYSNDRPLEQLTFEFLHGVAHIVTQVSPDAADRLCEQALDLLETALADRLSRLDPQSSSHRSGLLMRVKAHIAAHLPDPGLSPDSVAAALGISTRYINNLLDDEKTSFRRYVLDQRLEQCRALLSSGAQANRHISDIAFAWGFNDLAHFSRSFKSRFGLSPRDWRQRALSTGHCRPANDQPP